MAALATWTPEDGLLGAAAPLGLAAAAGTALVVDLDPAGPAYPGPGSLAELVADGPRRRDLTPSRPGLAVLRNGGVAPSEAAAVLAALADGWPALVLRLGPHHRGPAPAPLVRFHPLIPGALFPPPPGPAVYQDTGWRVPAPGPGPVLPVPRRSSWAALFSGLVPGRDRWVRKMASVWEWPWKEAQ